MCDADRMRGPEIVRSDGTRLPGHRVKAGTEWALKLDPSDLTWIVIDHSIRLRFGDAVVTIENDFVLRRGFAEHVLDPGEREELGPLLALYPDSLTAGSVDVDGTLHLTFLSGATIEVAACDQYEAWQVQGPGDYVVVCSPGTGELDVWD
jgi:hypothetical protein